MSLAALTGSEVNAFRLEVARRMRTENWNESIPWSSEAANKVIMVRCVFVTDDIKKGKGFSYSLPSVGRGADPGVQAVSLQVTISHLPGGRLPLLSARPAVTFPTAEHHRLWKSISQYNTDDITQVYYYAGRVWRKA